MIDIATIGLDRAVDLAVTAHMNALAAHLPPLTWTLYPADGERPQRLSGVANENQTGVLEQWALALGLAAGPAEWRRAYGRIDDGEHPNCRTVSGSTSIDGAPTTIRVWCSVDTPGMSA